jgi:hypothetical protein
MPQKMGGIDADTGRKAIEALRKWIMDRKGAHARAGA